MHGQLTVGAVCCLANIAIHAAIMAWVVIAARRASHATARLGAMRHHIAVMGAAVLVLLIAHVLEVGVWALVYRLVDLVPLGDGFYFAFVNYTTLGYGDILPNPEWRMLGPITAMNGVLLFGWSTAVIFEVLRTSAGALRNLPTHS
ncbi:MAG TPA: potassium channel family protein [Xanthobacteraceae bacterium]|jgi:hypothetical protein|nr:potassium channel family protein [Xanthobacteraceae bacterium]